MIIAKGQYPIPFRTRKSSPSAPMVLCLKTRKSETLLGYKSSDEKLYYSYRGAGFIGSNLIKYLLTKTDKKILSLDIYSNLIKNVVFE